MSRRPAVEVDGLRNLRRTLKAAGLAVDDLKAAHKSVAETVIRAALPRVPRRTGALAGTLRAANAQTGAVVKAGFAGIPYAGPIHWGWPARHITAQPFYLDAADSSRTEWEREYLSALEAIIATVEGRPGL